MFEAQRKCSKTRMYMQEKDRLIKLEILTTEDNIYCIILLTISRNV